ncbi:L-serine ammonia-lyase, iron-sulfur-dependent, subunit alpha [Clostridiaceae bacterium M8S5]|nr:L-serine ammonia-lyase, iron-sulfur-dependent, subunit alpha [Clostridiaceae bacterium M8S5]
MGCVDLKRYIDILKKEVVPALGCTEPIAVALAVAKAKDTLGKDVERVEVYVSPNIYKNGMGVGIPGTGMVGLDIASALGATGGNANAKLEVLKDITSEDIANAKKSLAEKRVEVKVKEVPNKLYIEAICLNGNDTSRVVIKDIHSNIVLVQLNDNILYKRKVSECDIEIDKTDEMIELSVKGIYEFAMNVDFKDIKFILEGAKLNKEISNEGLSGEYGLMVGKSLSQSIKEGILSDDIQSYAMAMTSAASDARMAGCMKSVMSNSGSGNQGITVILPVVAVSEKLNATEEELARALVMANLVAIHIKAYLGRLSALCGCVVASAGASCGITYLMGGKLENIKYSIKNMIGNISGMICDGAKTGCALKVSTGVSAAVQSSILAMKGIQISNMDGIIDKCVEKTIRNIAKIGSSGMVETDKMILDIMVSK